MSAIRVLSVEDSDDDAALILRELRRGGYEPLFERVDTAEAMNAAFDKQEWDVILCDYTMPRFTMHEALSIIKERGLDIPFIIVSGAIGEEAAVAVMRAGAHDYVMKDKLARLSPAIEREMRDAEVRRQREIARQALAQNERDYRALFESTFDGNLAVSTETLRIILANQTAARIYGLESSEQLVGSSPLDLVSPHERDRLLKLLVEDLRVNDARHVHEFRGITRDGRELWIELVGVPAEYQGKPVCLLSVRDITSKKRADEQKLWMQHQLQLAGRLAVVGELAAGVAHELNNPLAAVQAFAEFLATRPELSDTVRKDLETIHQEAQRAARITSNLLSFARRHKLEKRPVSVNQVLERSLELHAYRLRVNNIEVALDLCPNLPLITADSHQLQQVFVNIMANAEHAMVDSHGKGKLLIKTEKAGSMVRISFTDNGSGIPREELERIFDPFFTTKEAGKGTGLGLSICFGLVQEHNGRIYAESQEGAGTTFTVELPIEEADSEVPVPKGLDLGITGPRYS